MIAVLRLSHRKKRDKRISTHAGLVSRALGADKIIYTGDEDNVLLNSVNNVVKHWGGKFTAEYSKHYEKIINEYKKKKFLIVHLTMYGLKLEKEIRKIRKRKNILVIIGGEKVPKEIYELSDYNLSVTSQPHSEIAALALFLDYYYKGKELSRKFPHGKRIKPDAKHKIFI